MVCGTHGRSSHWKNIRWSSPLRIGVLVSLLTGWPIAIPGIYTGIAQAQETTSCGLLDRLRRDTEPSPDDFGGSRNCEGVGIPHDGSRLWERFFDTDSPEPPRDGSRGLGFCVLEPNGYEGVVWSDRPSLVFELQGTGSTLKLFRPGEKSPLWEQPLTEANQVSWVERVDSEGNNIPVYHVTYDGVATLSPGEDYIWKVSSVDQEPIWISILPAGEQGAIAQDLNTLEAELRQEGLNEDAIALERADYFAEQGLWDDFWNEVMGIEQPSEDFQYLMESTLSSLCS